MTTVINEEYDPNVLSLYNQFKDWSEGDKLDASNVIQLVTLLIPAVQKIVIEPHRGPYKKKVVINVLELLIQDSKLNNNAKTTLKIIVNTTVPITIDTLISVAKGDINVGKVVKTTQCCILQ